MLKNVWRIYSKYDGIIWRWLVNGSPVNYTVTIDGINRYFPHKNQVQFSRETLVNRLTGQIIAVREYKIP